MMKVIVTGGSKGIGRGIATFLASKGFHVGIISRTESRLQQVQQEIVDAGGTCNISVGNLRDPDATSSGIANLIQGMNGIDALINNAGLVIRKDVFNISLEEWHAQIETNINGLFYATRDVLPYLRDQGHGHIINISSISGHVPLPGGSGYAASKYAVTGFSESLFQEVRDYGIKVTTVFPGSVETDSQNEKETWKITPIDVGKACYDILTASEPTCISQLEIRTYRRPPK